MTEHDEVNERFDRELRAAARSLVTEDLPHGVLDASVGASLGPGGSHGGARPRREVPGFAVGAALVVLLLATAVAIALGSIGGPGPGARPSPTSTPVATAPPVLRPTADIQADLVSLGYACSVGRPLASIGPGVDSMARESAVCTAPADIGPLIGAVIVGESAAGLVVEVHVKAEIVGTDTTASRDAVASAIGKAAAVVVVKGTGNAASGWIEANLPALEPGNGLTTVVDGVALDLQRDARGGYFLVVKPAGAD